VVAEIAEVEVNRKTGHVWVKRLVCAHDCGLVINPQGLRGTIEGRMLHSLSRALHEEVKFDTEKVTSVDWNTHPTLTHATRRPDRHRAGERRSQSESADLPHYGGARRMQTDAGGGG
jgi:xanthine dehydrogenase molybdopterin-binding subunit B